MAEKPTDQTEQGQEQTGDGAIFKEPKPGLLLAEVPLSFWIVKVGRKLGVELKDMKDHTDHKQQESHPTEEVEPLLLGLRWKLGDQGVFCNG